MFSYMTHLHTLAPSPLIFPSSLCFVPSVDSSVPSTWHPFLTWVSSNCALNKKCWYLFLLGLAFFCYLQFASKYLHLGGGGEREKSFSLCMHLSDLCLLFFRCELAQRGRQRANQGAVWHKCCWPALVSCTGCTWGPQSTNCSHSCVLLLRNQDRAPRSHEPNWDDESIVLFPDRDTSQNSVLHPCVGDKIHLHPFSHRVPLQQTQDYTNWLAKKLISKTRNRLFWITKGNKMTPFISMFSMNGKVE